MADLTNGGTISLDVAQETIVVEVVANQIEISPGGGVTPLSLTQPFNQVIIDVMRVEYTMNFT